MKHCLGTLKTGVYFLALVLCAFVTLSHLEADPEGNEISSRTSSCVRLGLYEHLTLFVVLHFLNSLRVVLLSPSPLIFHVKL